MLHLLRHSILLMALLGFSMPAAHAAGIMIESVEVVQDNGSYSLNADVQYDLSDVALEALHKGVELTFKLTIAVLEPRPLVWDEVIISDERSYTISYQALTDQYQMFTGESALIKNFPSLVSALEEMGSLRDIDVALFERGLRENSEYVGVRAWLDIESLPVPMRLLAYSQPDWRHNSGWYKWTPSQ